MGTNAFADHLMALSQRLSVNARFSTLNDYNIPLSDDELFKNHYKNYHVQSVKTFDEAAKSPFFKLLIENLREGLKELPGWTNWMLLEYYDEAVNGLRLVLITDNKDGYETVQVESLNQNKHNLSLLLRAMRELHIHLHGWHFLTDFYDKKYHAENKIALDAILPESNNPYFNSQATDNHYQTEHKPILVSRKGEESDTFWRINRNENGVFDFGSHLNEYFELVKKISDNGNQFCNQDNTKLSESILNALDQAYSFEDTSRLEGKTFRKIAESIQEKFDRVVNNIVVDNKSKPIKPIELSFKNFADYCGRLCNGFNKTDEFMYLPVFTTLKMGKDPQRKDMQVGSVLVGINGDNTFKSEDIHALWRFVQAELFKWYNQYSSFVLYSANVQLKKEALLNALTQVFARNESHINGSHIIPYFLINPSSESSDYKPYLAYLQQRMELVASVQQYPRFLKGYYTMEDIRNEFANNSALNKGIADGINVSIRGIKDSHNIQFALPGHNLGEQLLLVFLEGMFRNCKKHGKITNGIILTYNISEPGDSLLKENYYVLDVWDNLDGSGVNPKGINKLLYQDVLKDNRLRPGSWGLLELKAAASLLINFPLSNIDRLNDHVSIIKKDGSFTETFEMDQNKYPIFIRAFLYNNEGNIIPDGNGEIKHLGYRLYLLKPKVLFTTIQDLYEKVADKARLVYKPQFSAIEACDFFIGDSYQTPHNYRELSNSEQVQSILSTEELWKEYAFSKGWDRSEFIFIYCNEQGAVCKVNGTSPDGSNLNINGKIVFDYHGYWYRNLNNQSSEISKTKGYFCLFSGNKDGLNKSFYFENDEWKYKYLEMINTQVTIIDERVQKYIHNSGVDDNSKMKMKEAFLRMCIFIPSQEEGMNLDNYDLNKVENYIEEKSSQCKYILLHHGIFEALCKNGKAEINQEVINNYYHSLHKPANGSYLVLISGSGVPSSLPDNSYFLNLSRLQMILEKKSKLHLVQVLHALRPVSRG